MLVWQNSATHKRVAINAFGCVLEAPLLKNNFSFDFEFNLVFLLRRSAALSRTGKEIGKIFLTRNLWPSASVSRARAQLQ